MDTNDKGRGALLVRNTLLNLIGQIVPAIFGVIAIPLIIRDLGIERFGLLSLAWAILGSFTIFDLGLGRATTKVVSEAIGKKEEEQLPALVWTAVAIQGIVGLLGAFILIGLTPLLIEQIIKIPPILENEAKITFNLLAVAVPVVLISSSFSGVLEATQRFDLINAVKVPVNTLSVILPLVGLLLGFKLPGIVFLILGVRFAALIALLFFNLKVFPELKKCSPRISLFPRLFSFGGWVMISNISSPIFTYSERFLIASFQSVGMLTYYAAPYDILSKMTILPASMSMVLFPAFSYHGTGNRAAIKEIICRPTKYLIFIMMPVAAILVIFADPILTLWLGKEFAQAGSVVFQILVVSFFFNSLACIPFTAVQGLGRPDLKAKLDLIELPIFVMFCWYLIPDFGLIGAALSKLFITLIDFSCLFWIAKKISHLDFKIILLELWSPIVISGIFALIVISMRLISNSLAINILLIVPVSALYILSFFKMSLDIKDKSAFQGALNQFLQRKYT